jgi:hypothetical protein
MMGYSRAGSQSLLSHFSHLAVEGFCQRRFDRFAIARVASHSSMRVGTSLNVLRWILRPPRAPVNSRSHAMRAVLLASAMTATWDASAHLSLSLNGSSGTLQVG